MWSVVMKTAVRHECSAWNSFSSVADSAREKLRVGYVVVDDQQ